MFIVLEPGPLDGFSFDKIDLNGDCHRTFQASPADLAIALSRMASVGSLTVATLMPITLLILGLLGTLPLIYTLYGVLAWMVIVYSHLPNIRRLIAGTERRLGEPRE